ncbi:MAG: hypothetical protein R3B90_18360 [Planctomycetaceae bacterium]
MRHWKASLFISVYLGALVFGLFSHAMSFLKLSHPAMYFIVWDMYCGWAGYENRMHLVGEGESGVYYDLSPPWGSFVPYGSADRESYDMYGSHGATMAINTLEHSEHEPIVRIMVVEESWSKKYNLPDVLWDAQYDVPKEPYSYYHVIAVNNRTGEFLERSSPWLTTQAEKSVMENPRLVADMRKGHTFFASSPDAARSQRVTPASHVWSADDAGEQ